MQRYNNIEWLRLIFALQVALSHGLGHFHNQSVQFLNVFPGVPAFFFISGFLIYASYSQSKSNVQYFQNRFYRIFPALLFVTIGGVLVFGYFFGLDHVLTNIKSYIIRFIAQITLGQAYNAGIFREIGVGVVNGSLWTISVEILFYIMVPLIGFFEKTIENLIYILILISFTIYWLGPEYLNFNLVRNKSLYEFLSLTPVVWGWMFFFGIVAFKNIEFITKHIYKFGFAFFPLMIFAYFDLDNILLDSHGNRYGLITFLLYSMFILYLAFGIVYFKLPIDLSYGIYIWHMVIINAFIMLHISNIIYMLILTILLAAVSWFVIEKPALKLKKLSFRNSNP